MAYLNSEQSKKVNAAFRQIITEETKSAALLKEDKLPNPIYDGKGWKVYPILNFQQAKEFVSFKYGRKNANWEVFTTPDSENFFIIYLAEPINMKFYVAVSNDDKFLIVVTPNYKEQPITIFNAAGNRQIELSTFEHLTEMDTSIFLKGH